MNERTHFFIKIYLSHFIRKGWCWLCVRGELETETDCPKLTPSASDHSSTSFSSWQGCSTVGHWGPKPSVYKLFSHWHLVPNSNCDWNWLTQAICGPWLYDWHPPASCGRTHLHWIQPRPQVKLIFRYLRPDPPVSLFFCLFTQVHLFIDGSVEGEYVKSL